MKLLITGGSGFIGTHLIQTLLSTDADVSIVNIDIQESKLFDSRLKSIIGNINRWEDLEMLDLNGFDTCIHLAALCKEPGFEWEEYFQTNYEGTKNVIRFCEERGIEKILFTSTMMVYKAGETERNEWSITSPDTAYGISKLLAEKEFEIWKSNNNTRWLKIIRPSVVFGENENGNFTRLYFSLKRGFFPYIGKKTTIKASIYVKELSLFISFLLKNETKENIYNFSFPEKCEMGRIVDTFKKVFGFKVLSPVLPYKPMIFLSYFFEFLNSIGIKNPIHHRRIQKLYYSTDIVPENALKEGYIFEYDLRKSLEDWKKYLKS